MLTFHTNWWESNICTFNTNFNLFFYPLPPPEFHLSPYDPQFNCKGRVKQIYGICPNFPITLESMDPFFSQWGLKSMNVNTIYDRFQVFKKIVWIWGLTPIPHSLDLYHRYIYIPSLSNFSFLFHVKTLTGSWYNKF